MIGYKLYRLFKASNKAYTSKTKTTAPKWSDFSCDDISSARRTNRTRQGETFSDLVEKVMREQREAKKPFDNHQSNMI